MAESGFCGWGLLTAVSFPYVSVEAAPGSLVAPACVRSRRGSLREVLYQFVARGAAIGVRRLQVDGCRPSSPLGLPERRCW